MDFDIGSNYYRNAEGSIEIDGLRQFSFEHNRRYNEMMLKGLIFDRSGTLAAQISENSLSLNIRGEYEIVSEASVVKIMRREKHEVLLELKFLDKDRVQIHTARLVTGKGHPFEVTPTTWRIGDKTHSGESVDCAGEPVKLA
jgi:hypothetical protein